MSDQPAKRKRRWPFWVLIILLIIAGVVGGGYWFAQRKAAGDIAKQLEALELGPHKIGSTSLGLNGVVANDIEFFKEDASSEQPWLTVDRLTVEHPLLELAQGASSYNAIELAGVTATLESASLFESETDDAPLDLSELELPAKQLRLKDAKVVIVDDAKPDVTINDIQLELNQNENDAAVAITGEVGDLLGTKVDITGELAADRKQLGLTLAAEEFNVATQQWKNLPGVPQGIDKTVTVDGKLVAFGCEVTLKNDDMTIDGSAQVGGLEIGLPEFDLPVSVGQGSIHFDAKKIELTELVATVDGSGEVQGKVDASYAGFPIEIAYDTQVKDVSAKSLRKIVVAIPDILNAEASGTAVGTVVMESSTRTTISLTANAAGTNGSYGRIKANTLGANVAIKSLVFDDKQKYESIDGLIDATAETDQQSLSDVLKTFELDVFDQQMQILGNANGKMNLQMPLATAEDMRTWKMRIEGVVPTGSVSGQNFVDADATVEMIDGILQFNPVNMLAVTDDNAGNAGANSNLKLNVRWPMVPGTAQGDEASIGITGAEVPATWLMGLAQKQIASSTAQPAPANVGAQPDPVGKPAATDATDPMTRIDQIDGSIGFETTLLLPTATPDDVYTWKVDGTLRDSKINVGDDRLQNLAGSIQMNDGQLNVQNIRGNFFNQAAQNGSIDGAAAVNLKQPSQASADLNLKQLPLPWLISVAREMAPEYSEQLKQPTIDSLLGQIDADIKYRSSPDNPLQALDVTVRSAELSASGQKLQDLKINGSFDGKQINVAQLTGRIGESGELDAQGNWSIETSQANGMLSVKQLPLPWIVTVAKETLPEYADQLKQPAIDTLTGQIGADVKFQYSPNDQTQSFEVALASPQMSISGQQIRDFKLDGSFDGNQIKVTQLTSRVGETGALSGQGDWSIETNQGAGNLNMKQIPLPLIVTIAREALPQYADQLEQPQVDSLAGQIGADVKFQVAANNQTQLDISLASAQMSIAGQQLRDFKLVGAYDGNQIKVAQLTSRIGENGELQGQGDWFIETNQGAGNLNMKKFPLPLIVSIAREALPQYADQLQQPRIDSLAGKIGADVKFQFSPDDQTQSLEVALASARVSVSGQELRDLQVNGTFDGKQVKVAQLKSFVGDGGNVEGQGNWSIETNQASGDIKWDALPLATLAAFADLPTEAVEGDTNGKLTISTLSADQAKLTDYQVAGAVALKDLKVQQFKVRDIGFDVMTQDGALAIKNLRTANGKLGVDLGGKIDLAAPYRFQAGGKIAQLPLTELLSSFTSIGAEVETASVTGLLKGDFNVTGQVENFDWKTNGKIDCLRPTYNGVSLEDIKANWDIEGNQWGNSKFTIEAFDGSIDLVELANLPDSIRLKMKNIDAGQLATIAELPSKVTGRIEGDLLLKKVDQPKNRSVDLSISGKAIRVGAASVGGLTLTANYLDEVLKYELNGSIFDGKLTGTGETSLKQSDTEALKIPVKVTLTNASVASLKATANSPSLRPLTGRLSAQADLKLGLDGTILADGRMGIDQARWNSQLITRLASLHFKLTNNLLFLDDLDIDLKRGTIAGQATIPLAEGATGKYEIAVRSLDLERLTEVYAKDIEAHGLLNARINGRIGGQISGRGFVGVERASLNGVAGESLRLPIQFQVATNSGSGKLELRRSRFRIFDGNATGKAEIAFGNSLNIDVDMNFSNIDTEAMIMQVAGVSQADQGKLTGRLRLSGRGVTNTRNLKGSFRGSLDKVAALELPILSDIGKLLTVSNLQSADFDSEAIELVLSNNQVEVKQLNFSSSLVKIAITGRAFLDGRLDLSAATRVETIQQPTLLDELAGSPLASLNLSPVGTLARVTEFLSDRIVFLKIGGNINRPKVSVDTSQQLPAEVIRYFLPSTGILSSSNILNN